MEQREVSTSIFEATYRPSNLANGISSGPASMPMAQPLTDEEIASFFTDACDPATNVAIESPFEGISWTRFKARRGQKKLRQVDSRKFVAHGARTEDSGLARDLQRVANLEWIAPKLTCDRYLAQTLTFKPYRGGTVSREAAIATLQEFLRRLQRRALGREYSRRRRQLQIVPILEGGTGTFDKHPHLHLLTEIPPEWTTEDFKRLSETSWKSLRLTSDDQSRHTLSTDPVGWLSYQLKLRDKPSYADSLVVECMHL